MGEFAEKIETLWALNLASHPRSATNFAKALLPLLREHRWIFAVPVYDCAIIFTSASGDDFRLVIDHAEDMFRSVCATLSVVASGLGGSPFAPYEGTYELSLDEEHGGPMRVWIVLSNKSYSAWFHFERRDESDGSGEIE